MQTDAETRETFYSARASSDIAAGITNAIADQYGPQAAKLATYAADNAYFGHIKPKREQ